MVNFFIEIFFAGKIKLSLSEEEGTQIIMMIKIL